MLTYLTVWVCSSVLYVEYAPDGEIGELVASVCGFIGNTPIAAAGNPCRGMADAYYSLLDQLRRQTDSPNQVIAM